MLTATRGVLLMRMAFGYNQSKSMFHAGVVGDKPCQQMVVQVGNRKPQVDKPGVL
jgi:hypothetical protein